TCWRSSCPTGSRPRCGSQAGRGRAPRSSRWQRSLSRRCSPRSWCRTCASCCARDACSHERPGSTPVRMDALNTFGALLAGGLLTGLVFALVAVVLTLIYGVMDVVNFAHGEFLMLAMYAALGLALL